MHSGDDGKKAGETPAAAMGKTRPGGERDMGAALRKVYQYTVEETIPAEMLDLLGKLD